jgi:hypothetical protein
VHFEFGPSTDYGSSTATDAIGEGTLAKETNADLSGLTPGTTYHFRVVGENQFGTTYGPDETFTTLGGGKGPGGGGADCEKLASLARKNRGLARRLRKKASRTHSGAQKQKLNRRASRAAKKAKSFTKRANACSGSGGRAGK